MLRRAFFPTVLVVAMAVSVTALIVAQSAGRPAPDALGALKFRYVGPVGNRMIAIAGVPGNLNTYYAGAASGGVWKTVDDGAHWDPVFDDQDVQATRARSGPAQVRRSSGATSRSATASTSPPTRAKRGHVWVSNGAGALDASLSIRRTPTWCSRARSAMAYGPQQDRGVFKTADGGRTMTPHTFRS
jgi:hypothetical protein